MSGTSFTVEQLKTSLEQVTGVISAKPQLDESGGLIQLHILSKTDRNPKQIVRDIESVCKAKFDFEIDHKLISVAQLEEEEEGGFFVSRLHPKTIHLSTTGTMLDAQVELFSDDGNEFSGKARGPASTTNRVRLAAAATLAAVEEYLHGLCEFILDDAVQFNVGNYEGVLVGLTLVTPKGDETLVGTALVQSDLSDAVIKAVLNAVNRRVVLMVAS